MDTFHRPGECDLTTNVDFAYLKEAIADLGAYTISAALYVHFLIELFAPTAVAHGPIPQAAFLERMHIQARVDALKKAATNEQRKADIERAAKRLVDRTGMGSQYQFMAVTGTKHLQPPPTDEQMWPFV